MIYEVGSNDSGYVTPVQAEAEKLTKQLRQCLEKMVIDSRDL